MQWGEQDGGRKILPQAVFTKVDSKNLLHPSSYHSRDVRNLALQISGIITSMWEEAECILIPPPRYVNLF